MRHFIKNIKNQKYRGLIDLFLLKLLNKTFYYKNHCIFSETRDSFLNIHI